MLKQKKTDKAMEARIQKLIDVYCSFVFGIDRDAGWHAPSQLESLFSASMAKTSGSRAKFLTVRVSAGLEQKGSDSSNDKMINEMRFVRNKHYDFKLAEMLFSKLEDKQLLALLAGKYLAYVYKRKYLDLEVSDYLGISKASYIHNKKIALIKIEEHLVFIDQYEIAKSA